MSENAHHVIALPQRGFGVAAGTLTTAAVRMKRQERERRP